MESWGRWYREFSRGKKEGYQSHGRGKVTSQAQLREKERTAQRLGRLRHVAQCKKKGQDEATFGQEETGALPLMEENKDVSSGGVIRENGKQPQREGRWGKKKRTPRSTLHQLDAESRC